MARKPSIHYPAACYHVILRGNGRQDIFFDAEDRSPFYHFFRDGIERFGHLFHGRYKAIMIDVDSYLVQLVAYIHQNPVRAGMVQKK
jgi:putative transposase